VDRTMTKKKVIANNKIKSSTPFIRKADFADINQMIGLLEELFSIEEDFIFNESARRQGFSLMLNDTQNCCIREKSHGNVQCSIAGFDSGRQEVCIN